MDDMGGKKKKLAWKKFQSETGQWIIKERTVGGGRTDCLAYGGQKSLENGGVFGAQERGLESGGIAIKENLHILYLNVRSTPRKKGWAKKKRSNDSKRCK